MSLQSSKDKYSKRKKLWEQGLSDSEIAEICGVSKSTIGYWRSNYGLKSNRTRGRQLNKKDVELRFKLITEGYSDSDMLLLLGFPDKVLLYGDKTKEYIRIKLSLRDIKS